ncbi:MAG: outer membrane beta-barrel protein [Vibrio gallaecicus]|uniref:Outer membrane beta-barrel protein n=1 Tax=Vibrio gallaecicus TaxID=552386 RepID=A0ABV4N8S2_9VIBR|nr:outer membrane beta-barrel protein [Vibrio gallaecicus]MDN3616664.1 outer membrane beta-barrel protein [Vibrio gallaecicus]
MNKSLGLFAFTTALIISSGSAIAQSQPGSFYTNVGATMISDGSDSETAYFAQAGYNHYLTPFVALDLNYRHTATLDSSVAANSTSFASKYNSYGLGLKLEQGIGWFDLYGIGGASYIDSEVSRWSVANSAVETTKESSIEPYASAGIKFAPKGSPLLLDAGVSYQWLPNNESAASLFAGAYLTF